MLVSGGGPHVSTQLEMLSPPSFHLCALASSTLWSWGQPTTYCPHSLVWHDWWPQGVTSAAMETSVDQPDAGHCRQHHWG